MPTLHEVISELGRRGVFRAGGIYLAAGWLILQVLDVVSEPLGLPASFVAAVIWLFVLGFPFALLFSWRYDLGPEGISLTPPPAPGAEGARPATRADFVLLGLLSIALAALALWVADLLQQQDSAVTTAPSAVETDPRSIAVLPFENLGGDEKNYLGQGLAEDILHRLTAIPGLRVAARTASFELDKTGLAMSEIGHRLSVRNVLEGSVRREGDRIRVIVQLVDAMDGYHRWSQRYDRDVGDLFSIYDEISEAVTTELRLTLAPGSVQALVPPTDNMQAYDYFLQGRSVLRRASDVETAESAKRFLANATRLDRTFAQAWAWECRAWLVSHSYSPDPDKVALAEERCREAISLEPELAEGHAALGDLFRHTGAYELAVEEYTQALEARAEMAVAWRGLGQAYENLGRPVEAERALLRAVEIDPDDLSNLDALGTFYFYQARYAEAASAYESLSIHPRASVSVLNLLGAARSMLGDLEGAADAYRQVLEKAPDLANYGNIGVNYYILGRYEDAVAMLREAVALSPGDPFYWSNLGDALREVAGGEEDALAAYRESARLAEELLMVDARDIELRTQLAHVLARLGDTEEAIRIIEDVLAQAPSDPYAYYFASLVYLEAGRKARALESIRQALELDYPFEHLRNDPQFEPLRTEQEFLALIESGAYVD